MPHDADLFGKTFDQQLLIAGDEIVKRDIAPNRRIPGEIVFEPMGNGVMVTARDQSHRVLWAFVGAKETLSKIHCLVAVYETLQGLLAEELDKRGLPSRDQGDPIAAADGALGTLEDTVAWLRQSLELKKISEATLERAKVIARIASDADRQIALEGGSLKGIKPRAEFTARSLRSRATKSDPDSMR